MRSFIFTVIDDTTAIHGEPRRAKRFRQRVTIKDDLMVANEIEQPDARGELHWGPPSRDFAASLNVQAAVAVAALWLMKPRAYELTANEVTDIGDARISWAEGKGELIEVALKPIE